MNVRSILAFSAATLPLFYQAPVAAQAVVELPAADRPLSLRLEPIFRVGTAAGPPWQEFRRLDHAAFGGDGRLYLVDTGGQRVIAVGPDGALLHTVGRPGQGPGEFQSPSGVAALPDGRVAVWDGSKRAFLMFGADGAHLQEVRGAYDAGLPDGPFAPETGGTLLGFPARIITGRAGHAFLTTDGLTGAGAGLPLLRIRVANGEPTRVLARAAMPHREPGGAALMAFEPAPSFGALANGRAALAHGDQYRVEVLRADGTVERVLTRPLPARRTTDADREAFQRSLEGRTVTALGGGPGRPLSDLSTASYPVLSPILAITTDGRSHIWVQRRDARDPTRPGPIDILAADGRYLGTVNDAPGLPAAFGPSGLVVFFEAGELDVPTAAVYRLPPDLR